MKRIKIATRSGEFAENKDAAKEIRVGALRPALEAGEDIILDFADVELATQSFIHALISDLIRSDELDALERLRFKNCSGDVRAVIEIVVDYSQEDIAASEA